MYIRHIFGIVFFGPPCMTLVVATLLITCSIIILFNDQFINITILIDYILTKAIDARIGIINVIMMSNSIALSNICRTLRICSSIITNG